MVRQSLHSITEEDEDKSAQKTDTVLPDQKGDDLGLDTSTGVAINGPLPDTGLLAFLRGEGPGPKGRVLDEVLAFDMVQMEKDHDFIQWLFPTDEPSQFVEVPLLTETLQLIARQDKVVVCCMRRSLDIFLAFLGLRMVSAPGEWQVKKANFRARKKICWTVTCAEGNHNWRRISRVLKSLNLLGLEGEARALYLCLERLWATGSIPRFAEKTMPFWRDAARMTDRSIPKYKAKATTCRLPLSGGV